MTRKEKCSLGAAGSVLLAVGCVENYPLISVLMLAALVALIRIGELWEA